MMMRSVAIEEECDETERSRGGRRRRGWAAAVASLAFGQRGDQAVVQACYTKSGGWIHLGTPASCKKNELPVSWSIVGPQGPPGSKGDTGATGPMGPEGPKGDSGIGYAHVEGGVLDTSRSRGVLSVTRVMGAYVQPDLLLRPHRDTKERGRDGGDVW